MTVLRVLFQLYIRGSIHVAVAVVAMLRVTQLLYDLDFDPVVAGFAFCSSVAGYNFVKYHDLMRSRNKATRQMRIIAFLSFCAVMIAIVSFFNLTATSQLTFVILGLLTVIYAIPFLGSKNARSWAGVKIHIVAICWTGMTVLMPAFEGNVDFNPSLYILMAQRYLLVVILLLIFDIVDMARDKPELRTIPMQIGIRRTKYLGVFLLLLLMILEIPKPYVSFSRAATMAILFAMTALFLGFANESRPRSYTLFWAESIPIFWWLMMEIW